jgi:hypothetical protein
MKKHILTITILLLFVGCDSKEVLFKMTIGGEFIAEKMINLRTGKSEVLNQRLSITDSTITVKNGQQIIIMQYPKAIISDSKEGKKVFQAYDPVLKTNKSIRIIYVGWPKTGNIKEVITSPIMVGDYEAKNDTVDVYYKLIQ